MLGNHKSPNFGERRDGAQPTMLVLHYTGMATAKEALDRLCDPKAEVSAHYFIDEDGKTLQLVPDKKRAWHAGVASWAGEADINSHSIGIEVVNPGHEFGYREFPAVQIEAVSRLCHKLIQKHAISPAYILAHSDIAPSRKEDPGELFPWEALAAEDIGLWPDPQDMDFQAAEDMLSDQASLHQLFITFGYDSAAEFKNIVKAFHRHFYPEKFRGDQKPEQPDNTTVARLLALMRVHHKAQNLKIA